MDSRQLQDLFSEFLQALGLHRPDQVPSGFSLSLSEMFALMALSAEAPMSQQVLAEQLHLEKSTVSRLIKHLERRGGGERGGGLPETRVFRLHLRDAGDEQASRLARRLAGRHPRPPAEPKPDAQGTPAHG